MEVTTLVNININMEYNKIGFGGGCHWCTEAVFQYLKGVKEVEQGWISSEGENEYLSEAIIVHYDSNEINIETLIEVHLLTHSSTSNHPMRKKYRSGIYYFSDNQECTINRIITQLQSDFKNKIITKAYPFIAFKASPERIQNFYLKNPKKPFCQRYISPKLSIITKRFGKTIVG